VSPAVPGRYYSRLHDSENPNCSDAARFAGDAPTAPAVAAPSSRAAATPPVPTRSAPAAEPLERAA